jgi:hypothetical protein
VRPATGGKYEFEPSADSDRQLPPHKSAWAMLFDGRQAATKHLSSNDLNHWEVE